jgi:hypothetical protein
MKHCSFCGYWKPSHSFSSFVLDRILCPTLPTHAYAVPLCR